MALAHLTGILVIAPTNLETERHITQFMKPRKLWVIVRTRKIPPSGPVTWTQAVAAKVSLRIS